MSGYLSRLVARASGAVAPVSMAPSVKSEPPRGIAGDPFEATAPFETTPTAVSRPAGDPPPVRASEIPTPPNLPSAVPAAQALPMSPAQPAPPPHVPSSHIAEREVRPVMVPPEMLPKVRMEQPTELALPQSDGSPKLAPITLPPLFPQAQDRSARKDEQPRREPVKAVEPAAKQDQQPLPAPVVVHETRQMLAPPPPATFAARHLAPEQPRLVIGRMRVDVVPSSPPAPAPAPQVIRVVERSPTPRGTGTPSSSLRFGLGQM